MYMKYSEKGLIAHIRESVLALRKDFGIKISHHEVPKNARGECENNKTNSIKKIPFIIASTFLRNQNLWILET